MSVEVIITRIKISFDYHDWKLLRSVSFKCANRFGLSPALGELLECRCKTNFPKLKKHEIILKWKRDILANDLRNISWHGVGFLWALKKEFIFFPLESWKNICEPPQMSVVKYEEGVFWYVCVFFFNLN